MYRNLLLVLHIAGVAAWLGANFTQLVLTPRFNRADNATRLTWVEATRFLGQRYYNVAGALIVITGVLLVIESPVFDFSAGFVAVGIAAVVIGGVTGVVGFERWNRGQVEALSASPPDGATASALGRRVVTFALLDSAIVLTAVLAMVEKWRA